MAEQDEFLTPDEQHAFTLAWELLIRLIEEDRIPPSVAGKSLLVTALSAFRKDLSDQDISAILYKYADAYATRHLKKD